MQKNGSGDGERDMQARVTREWRNTAGNWKRWEPYLEAGMWPVTHRMMARLALDSGCRVLDVGSGLGEPALALAAAVAPDGEVLGLDPAPEMIQTCRERAAVLGLNNLRFVEGTIDDLNLADCSFDRISARFSLMFVADPAGALRRLRGLLGAGGRLAVSAWAGPGENPLFAIPQAALKRAGAGLHPATAEMPSPLRFAADGELERLLRGAAFDDVSVEAVRLYQFARDAEEYWTFLTEIVPPFRGQFAALSGQEQEQVRSDVVRAVAAHTVGGVVRIPATAWVAAGVRT